MKIMESSEDIDLMLRVRNGDECAFSILVEQYRESMHRYFTMKGMEQYKEDLAQDTFIRLWKYRLKYKPTAKFTTFLYMIARCAWVDFLRKQIRFQDFKSVYKENITAITDGGINTTLKGLDIETALAGLSSKMRDVVSLAVHKGLNYQDISEELNISVGTVKSRMRNALLTVQRNYNG